MVVRQCRSIKYISTARVGSEIHSCYTTRGTDDEYEFEIIDATIVGVKAASTVRQFEFISPPIRHCDMVQRIDKCRDQLTAKLLFEMENKAPTILHAFSVMLYKMVNNSQCEDSELESPSITQERNC